MLKKSPLKVLIVDDTVLYRKIIGDVLAQLPGVQVVGSAHNGKAALTKINSLKPDLLTLDIEMPEINGIEVLIQLQKMKNPVGAIMLSTLTQEGGAMTMRALELGAFDFIPKPQSGSMTENKMAIKNVLAPIIKAFIRSKEIRERLKTGAGKKRPLKTAVKKYPVGKTLAKSSSISEIIAIGISTGGPNALSVMLPQIPADIGVPILIVQHMPPVFTKSLATSLNAKCKIKIKEAVNGESLTANTAYIAPGGKQMKIMAGADGKTRVIKITNDPPVNSCKPSVDYLFDSIAQHYIGRATGVIMTGMGYDGTSGLKLMKQNGAAIIAQDKSSCVVFGMPKEPIEAGIVDVIAPLGKIAQEIVKTVKKK